MPDCDVVFTRIAYLTGQLGEEFDNSLVHTGQAAFAQRYAGQRRGDTLGDRLDSVLLIDGAIMEILLRDQVSVLDYQQRADRLNPSRIQVKSCDKIWIQTLILRCRHIPIATRNRRVVDGFDLRR